MPFLVLFVFIPLAEILVFINVSGKIGLGSALLFALLTAVLGGMIVRFQGIKTMMSAQNSLRGGALPTKELFDGLCLVAAGATLITPRFITDALGFALLVPAVRNYLRHKLSQNAKFSSMEFGGEFGNEFGGHQGQPHDPNVIEAEFETISENDNEKDGS